MDRDISRKLLQCYPIILEMLTTRGFDTSMYSPMTVEMVKVCASKEFLDPIVVTKTEDTVRESNSVTWSFTTGSREDSILDDLKKNIHLKRVEIEKMPFGGPDCWSLCELSSLLMRFRHRFLGGSSVPQT